ncbi:MAG: hemerythrin domain-containing protein [Gammaproteobacteria bacterium]
MKPIIDKLHDDHINFITLLGFLENQQHLLKSCQQTDLEAVLDAIRYMKEYPDLVHHPLENVVFKYFLENHDEMYHELKALLHEHDELPVLTDRLMEMLQSALADVPQKREDLYRYLQEYVAVQKEHMSREEALVYPTIKSVLNNNDWENINSELAFIKDPLFGDSVKKYYQALLQKVIG